MTVWMLVTADKYELPLYYANRLDELSALVNRSKLALRNAQIYHRVSKGKFLGEHYRIERVVIDDD